MSTNFVLINLLLAGEQYCQNLNLAAIAAEKIQEGERGNEEDYSGFNAYGGSAHRQWLCGRSGCGAQHLLA